MMHYFKAILLRDVGSRTRGTVVEVAAGGADFNIRWLALQPTDIAGTWLLPSIDADHAITTAEAAHAVSFRRGWTVPVTTIRRYLAKGTISCAGRLPGKAGAGYGAWMMSREEVWTFAFRERGNPNWIALRYKKPKEQEASK